MSLFKRKLALYHSAMSGTLWIKNDAWDWQSVYKGRLLDTNKMVWQMGHIFLGANLREVVHVWKDRMQIREKV